MQEISEFKKAILSGIPAELPSIQNFDSSINRAPIRKKS